MVEKAFAGTDRMGSNFDGMDGHVCHSCRFCNGDAWKW